jgi:hypothetical protein
VRIRKHGTRTIILTGTGEVDTVNVAASMVIGDPAYVINVSGDSVDLRAVFAR